MSLLSGEPPPGRSRGAGPLIGLALLGLALSAAAALSITRRERGGDRRGSEDPARAEAARPVPGATTATLRVTADTEGALVNLDGQRLGLAPQTASGLEPGRHRLRVERFGRRPFEEAVELDAGEERELHVRLEAAAATESAAASAEPALRVVADIPGASVFIDRRFVGRTPLEIARLEPGPHRLNVSAEGFEPFARELDANQTPSEIRVSFREVRLARRVAVRHKRAFGSRSGMLAADPQGLRFESENPDDSFQVSLDQLQDFEVDYLKDNLRVKIRGGRTYNFASRSGDPDELFVFHRDVERARTRLPRRPAS